MILSLKETVLLILRWHFWALCLTWRSNMAFEHQVCPRYTRIAAWIVNSIFFVVFCWLRNMMPKKLLLELKVHSWHYLYVVNHICLASLSSHAGGDCKCKNQTNDTTHMIDKQCLPNPFEMAVYTVTVKKTAWFRKWVKVASASKCITVAQEQLKNVSIR